MKKVILILAMVFVGLNINAQDDVYLTKKSKKSKKDTIMVQKLDIELKLKEHVKVVDGKEVHIKSVTNGERNKLVKYLSGEKGIYLVWWSDGSVGTEVIK